MSLETHAAAVLVAVTLVASVLGGPLIGADLTVGAPTDTDGRDNATLSVVRVPDGELSLRRADFGAAMYHLAGPPARVRVEAVRGRPRLKYAVDIPALGIADSRAYPLHGHAGETLSAAPPRTELSPQWIDREHYNVTLALWVVEEGNRYRSVFQETVTVEVEG